MLLEEGFTFSVFQAPISENDDIVAVEVEEESKVPKFEGGLVAIILLLESTVNILALSELNNKNGIVAVSSVEPIDTSVKYPIEGPDVLYEKYESFFVSTYEDVHPSTPTFGVFTLI